VKYDKIYSKLIKDRDLLLVFNDFPAVHWKHIWTTNPIGSIFATVLHRAGKTKVNWSRKTGLAKALKPMILLGTLLRNTPPGGGHQRNL